MLWQLFVLVAIVAVFLEGTYTRPEFPVLKPSECAVFVTGVSSGIGHSAVKALLSEGYNTVYGSVRKESDAKDLGQLNGFVRVKMDVTKPDEVVSAKSMISAELSRKKLKFCALVNNAGVSGSQLLEAVNIEDARHMFDVNYFGLLHVTQTFLPLLRESKGRIINIGSLAGKVVRTFSGVYSSTKFAVEALSDGLRRELHPLDISVSLVQPGAVQSVMVKNAGNAVPAIRKELESKGLLSVHAYRNLLGKREKASKNYNFDKIDTPEESTDIVILHAIQSPQPRARYPTASFGPLPGWLIASLPGFLPDSVSDYIIRSLGL